MAAPVNSVAEQPHYDFSIEPITYIQANKLGYEEGNIVKYVTRHQKKNGAEDIRKLIQYAKYILAHQYGITEYDK